MIEVGIDLQTIWARFWKPTWRHVGHFFLQNVGPLWRDPLFFVGSMFFFRFLVILALSWRLLGSIFGGRGSISRDFWRMFRASWLTLGMCSAALAGLRFRCSWLRLRPTLPRKSKNLPRTKPRIQEPAEVKAENKIRTNASKKTQMSKLSSSKLLS